MTTEKKILEALSIRDGELSILDELYEAAYVAMKDAERLAQYHPQRDTGRIREGRKRSIEGREHAMRRSITHETMPKAPAQPEPVEESPVSMLTLNEVITVSSTTRKYTIDRSTEDALIESLDGDGEIILKYDDIDTLIIELRMIRRKMGDSIKVGLVPW